MKTVSVKSVCPSAVIARQAALLLDRKPFLTADETKDRSSHSNFQPESVSFLRQPFFFQIQPLNPFTVLYWGGTRISPRIKHDISLMSAIWPFAVNGQRPDPANPKPFMWSRKPASRSIIPTHTW